MYILKKLKIFLSIYMILTVFFIIIQQSIVASSVWFLTKTIISFQEHGNYIKYFTLYLFMMTVPYIPGYLSFVVMQRWINKTHKNYVDYIKNSIQNNVGIYTNKELKKKIDTLASSNSFLIIKSFIEFIHNYINFFLNSFLSLLMIGFVLPLKIYYGYIFSIFASLFVILITKEGIKKQSFDCEKIFTEYSGILDKICSNVTIGNVLNYNKWNSVSNDIASGYYKSSYRLELNKNFISYILSVCSLLPTLYIIVSLLFVPDNNMIISVVIVNLTRIFQVLGSLSTLVSYSLEWSDFLAKVSFLFDIRICKLNLDSRVNYDSITINNKRISDVDSFLLSCIECQPGRYVVRGKNGAGKTSLLLKIKDKTLNHSLYLPASDEDMIWDDLLRNGSTGEKIISAIEKISHQEEIKILLLDEWDANLDFKNREMINHLLDRLSKYKIIFEISHH